MCIQLKSLFVSELSIDKHGWHKLDYVNTYDVGLHTVQDNVERVDDARMSIQEFIESCEKPYKPVVVKSSQRNWKANSKWTLQVL